MNTVEAFACVDASMGQVAAFSSFLASYLLAVEPTFNFFLNS